MIRSQFAFVLFTHGHFEVAFVIGSRKPLEVTIYEQNTRSVFWYKPSVLNKIFLGRIELFCRNTKQKHGQNNKSNQLFPGTERHKKCSGTYSLPHSSNFAHARVLTQSIVSESKRGVLYRGELPPSV